LFSNNTRAEWKSKSRRFISYRSPITRDVFAKKERINLEQEKGESLDHNSRKPKVLVDVLSSLAELKLPNFSNKPTALQPEPIKINKKPSNHPNVALSHQNFLNVFAHSSKNEYSHQLERIAEQSHVNEYFELEILNTTTPGAVSRIVYVPALALFSYEVGLIR